jgi:hypothetical protein
MQSSVPVKLSADLLGGPAPQPPGEVIDEQVTVEGRRHDEPRALLGLEVGIVVDDLSDRAVVVAAVDPAGESSASLRRETFRGSRLRTVQELAPSARRIASPLDGSL